MSTSPTEPKTATNPVAPQSTSPEGDAPRASSPAPGKRPREIGGPSGPEPTRYGDWERNGRVSDF